MATVRSSAKLYAEELGIPYRRVLRIGEVRLRSMTPEARAIILKPYTFPNSQTVHDGGMAARGWKKQVRGVRSQAERVA